MPEDAKWSMRWANKVLLNVDNFTLPKGLTPKVHVQNWSFVFHCGTSVQGHV